MFPIHTPTLTIRHFTPADLCALPALFDEPPSPARTAWLDWTCQSYTHHAWLHQPPYGEYAVTQNDILVAAVGLVPCLSPFCQLPGFPTAPASAGSTLPPYAPHTPEVGLFWHTHPAHRRRGIATQAAGELTRAAFRHLHLARLVATTEHTNLASIAVMRKLGMLLLTNPHPTPPWLQVVGLMPNPCLATIRPYRPADRDALTDLWLASVRATHHFLTEDDLTRMLPLVRDKALSTLEVHVVELANSPTPVGFMGLTGQNIDALFIHPAHFRTGLGRLLINHARTLHPRAALTLDVNEQNPQAVAFYVANGFQLNARSPTDSQGRPFPILHMQDTLPP